MPFLKFTEFVPPMGERRETSIEVDDETYAKAQKILEKPGFEFTTELLRSTNTVALYITDNENEEDVAIKLVQNGFLVPEAVKQLIMEYKL
jgi:hypothetical protein